MKIKGYVMESGHELQNRIEMWKILGERVFNINPESKRYTKQSIAIVWGIHKDKTRFTVVVLEGEQAKPDCGHCRKGADSWNRRKIRFIYDDARTAEIIFDNFVSMAKLLYRGEAPKKAKLRSKKP